MCGIYNIIVLGLLGLIVVSEGQIIQNGQCQDPVLQANFNMEQFSNGTWYEYARSDHPLGGDCSTLEFTQVGSVYTVAHKVVAQNFRTDYFGTVTVPADSARLALTIPGISSTPINFWVLLTVPTAFALVYNCENISNTQRRVYIWQLSKNQPNFDGFPNIPIVMNNTINDLFQINSNDLYEVDHSASACYELPVVQPGQPVVLPGQCDANITAVQNFSAGNFLGVWHEIYSYHSENALGTCGRAQYSSVDGVVVDVVNSQVINQTLFTIEGNATVASTDGSGKLNVVLQVTPTETAQSELIIIATDYSRWAISYTCVNLPNNQKRVFSWILSRSRTLTPEVEAAVDSVVASIIDLNYAYYQLTNQTNSGCFYIPVESDGPVFGGQCDLTIPVQANFVAANYLNLWHDIESFPTPFQFGTCANAFYSLGDVGVDVRNTQVVNQTLDVINGIAIPVGGEAKLVVTFPVEGTNLTTETDYWIISTNYVSYSLVYSCRNINDYQQQISMWKLSRTKALLPADSIVINNALGTQAVFDTRFFRTMNQTPEACFYYPEPSPGTPVVFPGQCDDEDVPVVSNLNLNLFGGTWYEVQAYPKEFQPGVCVSHQFSAASNSVMNLTSTSVTDQLLVTTNSQLTLINGTNARFNLTISNGTNTIQFPYYIVDTDYFNYALAYSCVNIASDFKGIYSWKLSRSQVLSNTTLSAISTAMEPIRVLREEYFEPVDQSDAGCFFFPDLAPGEPVILPGQCDNDSVIPVMTNFNAAAYLGRWRLIESYPSAFQVGQCNQARYSLNDNGTVLVYNTEVVNQTLSEATGVAVLTLDSNNQTIGKLQVTFPESPVPFELWVLDTDYISYTLVYGCVNLSNNQRQVLSWKMSRTTNLTLEAIAAINAVTSNVTVLNDRYYQSIDHSDEACFYYPDLDPTSTVIFPGQCDENIQVVTNFDAVGYMNLWHDIERYPAPFQNGTCGNAFYTLLDGPVVDVFNTQVLNQTLDTIRGSAVLDLANATDTSAKLLVTFPVGGFNLTTPYWVLSTDYVSYALVYSCTNIDSERRSVTSWKLSRTKALTTAAVAAINQVVNTIDVLDDRYYLTQDQSTEGCFYFPDPQPGVPVVFPGQCNVNISVVQNFNLSAFEGTWHEIEAYPKEEEGGQCISHQFTLTGANDMNFTSSNVIAQSLGITTGTVRYAFNDSSGRFFLDFVSNGTQISIPYWIIDTDYQNYALAYSCVNQGADFRGVWSWKLSRTRELTEPSRLAIDQAIADIIVLDNVYYEPINQTDNACFYLPDTNPGEPTVFPGQCDANIRGVQNFNASAYLGLWRTIESYPSDFQLGTCGDATYSLNDNGTVDVFNTEVINQTLSTINGIAVVASTDGTGELLVTFPDAPFPSNYYILATDYENYALVYSCFNISSDQRRVYSWKLSRTNTLTPAAVTAINQVVNSIDVLNERYYEPINRTYAGCFYFPEPNGDSVVFRGQCDENIPVVTNFDAVAYMNLWHDIERYPAPFQNGTCGNAFYTLLDGPVVDVFNTQVLNQTLDTIRGSAVLDLANATDTSAKLLVTFPVGGFNLTTPYWVLATDYISYALVYSCTNINEYYKSVTSWKLSRSKALTSAAVIAINQAVNSVNVLDDRYYIPQDQSPEGCFYFPEPQPGVPVVFPGQCDVNITVVQNFNYSRFTGRWHEIEAYPKEEQTGQCISHEFSNENNVTTFESYNVVAQSLGITSGAVRFTATDGSARLELQFVSNGTTITIPYWIVDTDYDNYALVYSCVNQGSDFRGVWSWKLSRSKVLSAPSIIAINETIADIEVLDNVYYEPISQSDDSCFFFPDLAPGEPVIFPGQCDTNITGVDNFDALRYLDRWYMIETYLSEFQLGECGDATYTLNPNGTVDVFNTEVVNQTLSTINGLAVASDDGTGKLYVTFPGAPVPLEYYILATDYDNYALVYSCSNINSEQRRVYSWKLSRGNSLTPASEAAINAAVSRVDVLDSRYYRVVNRTDEGCFYFPEPDGRPVIFRGQCDESIGVVMGFDATRYEGIWYDIESYPAPFQGGTCGTANYDLDLETLVVSVTNTQVIDPDGFGPVLDVQKGTAVLASNDTSAKLLVTFEVNGVNITTDYWVLATDYDNYALVYSCQNILNNTYRQVNSWKLSRGRSLRPADAIQIAAAIDRVQVLEQTYFVETGQSEDDCFFYPDNEGGDVILDGQCVSDALVPAMTNFTASLFSGTWHEVARFPSDLQVGECTAAEYSVSGQNNITITKTEVNNEFQTESVISGTLSSDGRGVINVTTAGLPFSTFYVLDTDYNEFALIYGCRNIGNSSKQVYSWKFARSRAGLSPAANDRIDELVRNNTDLYENYYTYTNQSNDACFHYPEFDDQINTIDLPGPCDERIRGVNNFNATAYLGRWIEIERYPQPDQFGTCDRAYYSPGEGNVLVRNTQVVNQSLAEQLGFAEVASTDGTGVLAVTFVVNGITVRANYYVLATDYNSYALVYSCRNLTDGRRRVSSWKLSRNLTLSAQANSAINSLINQTQGLSQQYYRTTNQSEGACFYVPELNVNEAPAFRGQCEDIVGISNFNASRYTGWWHEIERYPVDSFRGECISSQYQVSGSSFSVTDTAVANGTATVSSGTVQITADGRLRRTIGGRVEDIWVLATDYETYALLYSCENVDSEYRRIWSAKHSKSRALTTAAQSAMAPVIESNRLLYPQFYLQVNQSDAACFHYPELTGQQVILPGQCDDNIPVVQNFDVSAYEGTWYQMERYPQIHENQRSTCIGARYTLNQATGVVTLLNWEVIDGVLMTIEGNATIVSSDGSAKLSVVLPVRDSPTGETVTTSLYVLQTDYLNYALAYSCSNINAFQRSIGAWKLSRERTLSPQHAAAIASYMATREELHQPYFVEVQHDEACEEPSSGAFLRSSIVVMIICALWQILS